MCSATYTEHLKGTLESQTPLRLLGKTTITKTWNGQSRNGSCCVSNAPRSHETSRRLSVHPVKPWWRHITGPEGAMQFDLVPKLHQSGGCWNIVTAMEWTCFPDTYRPILYRAKLQLPESSAISWPSVLADSDHFQQWTRLSIPSDQRNSWCPRKHARTCHDLRAQTIGMLERTNASTKKAIEIGTGERRSILHKYDNIAVLNYNTSFHTSIGCETSRVFHGCVSYNVFELKVTNRPQKSYIAISQIALDVFDHRELIFKDIRKNSMQSYIK